MLATRCADRVRLIRTRRWYNTVGPNSDLSECRKTQALDRITSNPAVLNGQPCIRGMRLTVRRVLEALAAYQDRNELRTVFPELDDEDIRQALKYAAAHLDDKVLELPRAV